MEELCYTVRFGIFKSLEDRHENGKGNKGDDQSICASASEYAFKKVVKGEVNLK